MSKISIHNVDFDELDDYNSEENFKSKKTYGKYKTNNDESYIHQSQRESTRRGEGDSHISKRSKARS